MFTPKIGEDFHPSWRSHSFQMGWFNHHPLISLLGTLLYVVGRSRFGVPKHLLIGYLACSPPQKRNGINLEDDLEDDSDFSSKRGSCFVFPFRWCICWKVRWSDLRSSLATRARRTPYSHKTPVDSYSVLNGTLRGLVEWFLRHVS